MTVPAVYGLAEAAAGIDTPGGLDDLARFGAKTVCSRAVGRCAAPVIALSQAQQRAISKIDNIIRDHLTLRDLQGALRDMIGNPVPKPSGGYWDHVREVNEAIRGLWRHLKTLDGVADPAARAARQRAFHAIMRAQEFTKGAGL
jgi:filamentous hemagglutinin